MKVENRAATGGGQLYQARDPSGGQSGHRAGGGGGAQSQRINCHQFPSNPIRISEEEEEEEEEDCLSLMRQTSQSIHQSAAAISTIRFHKPNLGSIRAAQTVGRGPRGRADSRMGLD